MTLELCDEARIVSFVVAFTSPVIQYTINSLDKVCTPNGSEQSVKEVSAHEQAIVTKTHARRVGGAMREGGSGSKGSDMLGTHGPTFKNN